MSDVKTLVENVITNNRVAVFSKSYCPYCKKAKALISSNYAGIQTEILELDEREDGSAIQDYLQEKTGQRTVPNIFIDQKHIGGSSDLVQLENSGELAKLLN